VNRSIPDLKSAILTDVWVRVPLPAPTFHIAKAPEYQGLFNWWLTFTGSAVLVL
jgi:hypothetical protein